MVLMNTTLQRINAVTALATTAILCLLGAISLVSYPATSRSPDPNAAVHISALQVISGRARWHLDKRIQDYLEVTFDLDADFSPLFNWNTKQIFLSLTSEYETSSHATNQVVIWDQIIRNKEDAHVVLQEGVNKYGFRSISTKFDNITSADFVFKWNVMPYVGWLAYGDVARTGAVPVPAKATPVPGDYTDSQLPVEQLWY